MANDMTFHSRPRGTRRGRLAAFLLIAAAVPALAQSLPGPAAAVSADGVG